MPTLTVLFGMLRAALTDRQKLLLEIAVLRQRIIVLKRRVPRPQIEDSDRAFFVLMHRKGAAWYWARKSRPKKRGAPSIGWKLVRFIQRLKFENVTWAASMIQQQLAMLGHDVAESSVDKYMVKRRDLDKGQRWSTSLRNHMQVTAACDFFLVPTLTFKMLYAFVVLSHDRRRIRHVGVTAHPTAEWTARQVREASPDDGNEPKYLLHDRDGIYGYTFHDEIRAM